MVHLSKKLAEVFNILYISISMFNKNPHIRVKVKGKHRFVNLGLVSVIILGSAFSWVMAEFSVLKLQEIGDDHDSAVLNLIQELRPDALAQGSGNIYYLRQGGNAASKAAATGPCTANSATMSLATHNKETFSPGDVIIVCDTGGGFNTTDFIPPSSGSGQNRIEYRAEANQKPVFEKQAVRRTLGKRAEFIKIRRADISKYKIPMVRDRVY
jgi:hypothetical protein